ncbi:aldehyde dehydrogenase [Actinomadura sp. KC216]|uniref:aldehyde dehydrogenase family protein n=1 Tax=Actinomadura sp. KC216 TaxID=2530370 RepID=UPI00104883C3|nr:aldehyde dehydrogenase family protein [Actinomadura sp. KC216]TDB91901.1 aldehyde dehydrogenase [Actinomadura sp. KC216]
MYAFATAPPGVPAGAAPGRGPGDLQEVHDLSMDLVAAVLESQRRLLDVLTEITPYDAARDELHRAVRTLTGATWEIARSDPGRLGRVAVFLPSNNVFYSYVLFGLVPALYADEVAIRPSMRTRDTALALHETMLARRPWLRDRIRLADASQRDFVKVCADADAVVFTGQYDNGRNVLERVGPGPLFMIMGSGPNPMVVGPAADPAEACRALLISRLYNSGQDCLCTDLVFVHRSRLDTLAGLLRDHLGGLPVGDRRRPGTVVAPLVYEDAVQGAAEFLTAHREHLVYGGEVRVEEGHVAPSVVVLPDAAGFAPPELFAPIFCLCPYDDVAEIQEWAASPGELDRGMYATVFGEPALTGELLGSAVIRRDQTTFDAEDGNRPFGGYGPQASSVHLGGELVARPLLLSAEAGRARRRAEGGR